MRVFITTIFAAIAVTAIPSAALAQDGFTDYRQAAVDQYGAPSQNPGNGTSGSSAGGNPPSNANPDAPGGQNNGNNGNGNANGRPEPEVLGAGNTEPVAVARPTEAATVERGTLPFTGGSLGVIALIGLTLLAAGLLLAAATRARRRQPAT
jgi:hypothetical protein